MKAPNNITVKKANGDPFLGVLLPPVIKPVQIATQAGLSNIKSVVEFGNTQNESIYFKDASTGNPKIVMLRIPVPDMNFGDRAILYYSPDGVNWTKSNALQVINGGNGDSYIFAPVDHETIFAIGSWT